MKQLNIFEAIEEQEIVEEKIDKPYFNELGEPLPWEDTEYFDI